MKRHSFDLKITVTAPFIFPGIKAGRYGLDRVALRRKGGDLVLPMDQVRGILRHGIEELAEASDNGEQVLRQLETLFGRKSGDAAAESIESYEPARGILFLTDLSAAKPPKDERSRAYPRVKIDAESGAAEEGKLMFIEQLAPPGTDVTFRGELAIYCGDEEVTGFLELLKTALLITLNVGAYKSVGFGLIRHAASGITPAMAAPSAVEAAAGDRLEWSFNLDRPYLVDSERIADNAYLGAAAIPGGALKGCLARNLQLLGHDIEATDLSEGLSRLRIGFARDAGKDDKVVPFSLCYDHTNGRFHDLLCEADDGTLEPEFAPDWKPERLAAAREHLGIGAVATAYQERLHTRISRETGAAADQDLFSTLAVEQPAQGFKATLDFSQVDQNVKAILLSTISNGLDGLGRTGARVESARLSQATDSGAPITSGRFALIVRTKALLAQYSDRTEDARAAYEAFWQTVLPNSNLQEFYARQELAGGYLGRRFRMDDGEYRPFLLTLPGSVFLFDLDEDDIPAAESLLQKGICRKTFAGTRLTWANCPFVPENGYGTMSVHALPEPNSRT